MVTFGERFPVFHGAVCGIMFVFFKNEELIGEEIFASNSFRWEWTFCYFLPGRFDKVFLSIAAHIVPCLPEEKSDQSEDNMSQAASHRESIEPSSPFGKAVHQVTACCKFAFCIHSTTCTCPLKVVFFM